MELKWRLNEDEFERYKVNQHNPEYQLEGSGDGNYIGCVRCGELCYDILEWGNHIWFDLYVGGVDTGYGYGKDNYPYDYCDVASFSFWYDVSNYSVKEFKNVLSAYIREELKTVVGYYVYGEEVNLIEKANKELKEW